jgi:hypothetical protein
MEGTQLKKKKQNTLIIRRHRGLALPVVLMIAIIGALLVAAIFDIATRFGNEDVIFRRSYQDQVTAASYVEGAKGLLSNRIANQEEAIHPGGTETWNALTEIATLDDIQVRLNEGVGNDPLEIDEPVNERRIRMRVYDLTYSTAAPIRPGLSEEELVQFPAPLDVNALPTESITGFEDIGNTGLDFSPDTGENGDIDLREIGVYLIRVQISNENERLVRTTEESFLIRASD